MNPGKVIDLQREREARENIVTEPRTTIQQIVELLSRLDALIEEKNYPGGGWILFGIFNLILADYAAIKETPSFPTPASTTHKRSEP